MAAHRAGAQTERREMPGRCGLCLAARTHRPLCLCCSDEWAKPLELASPGQSITIPARRPFLLLSDQLETQLVFRQVAPCQPGEFVLTCAKVFRAEVEDVPAQPGVISEKIPRVRIPGILQRNGRPRAVGIDAHQTQRSQLNLGGGYVVAL